VVTSADGDFAAAAQHRGRLRRRAHIGRAAEPDGLRVLTASALTGTGISEVRDAIVAYERAGQNRVRSPVGEPSRPGRDVVRGLDTLTERFRHRPRGALPPDDPSAHRGRHGVTVGRGAQQRWRPLGQA
jgi:hypothetical protein